MPGAVTLDQRREGLRLAQRKGADEHALDARGEHRLDGLLRAQATADLQPHVTPGEPGDERGMLGRTNAGASGVEVDHVQPGAPGRREALGERFRIPSEVGRLVEPPLHEAYDAAARQVDGREELQRQARPGTTSRARCSPCPACRRRRAAGSRRARCETPVARPR